MRTRTLHPWTKDFDSIKICLEDLPNFSANSFIHFTKWKYQTKSIAAPLVYISGQTTDVRKNIFMRWHRISDSIWRCFTPFRWYRISDGPLTGQVYICFLNMYVNINIYVCLLRVYIKLLSLKNYKYWQKVYYFSISFSCIIH